MARCNTGDCNITYNCLNEDFGHKYLTLLRDVIDYEILKKKVSGMFPKAVKV